MPHPDTTTFVPSELEGVDRYKLLTGLVVPRPIGWVGTLAPNGRPNLAPYSFFNVVAGTPPTVVFSPGRRAGGPKDTLANVIASREFTINVVDERLAEAMNLTSSEFPPDIDEFASAELAGRPGDVVAAPVVVESPASLECRVTHIVEITDPPTNAVVFGEVVRIHVRSDLVDGTVISPAGLKAIGKMAGSGYTRTVDGYFEMDRPVDLT
ncbi:MAG: flavin reductase family protein [Actinomycetota bacterium]|nr:flavin reductase family protein [Actinomycetota bacterium]